MKDINNVMVDIETLGTQLDSVVLSIGATAFSTKYNSIGPMYYQVININSCLNLGMVKDPETVEWWKSQPLESRKVVFEAENQGLHIENALYEFSDFLTSLGLRTLKVWGNGADFDISILAFYYYRVGIQVPWSYKNVRCFRTLKSLSRKEIVDVSNVIPNHNALDDATAQALQTLKLLQAWKNGS